MTQTTEPSVQGFSEESASALKEILSTLAPLAAARASDEELILAGRRYLSALADGGWLVPTWPKECGGRGADKAEAAQIRALVRKHPAPDLYPYFVGLHMVGPTLLRHGDSEQQRHWLPAMREGSHVWCQMFSEPGAGSDLANVSTRATRTETGWNLNGQKVWTSRGAYANYGLCLARTDADVPKHAGMSMFIVSMSAPGVTVRPLHQMNGDDHFSEVFLDDVEIAPSDLIGATGDGWKIATTVLAFERSSIATVGSAGAGRPRKSGPRVPEWLQAAADAGQLDDPVRRNAAMAVFVAGEVARLTSARAAAKARSGGAPGPEGSGQKLRLASSAKRRAYLLKDLQGAEGMLTRHRGHDAAMTAPSLSIRGGTDEIQRNIVAERVLGLPPEPRTDRDQSWSAAKRGPA